MMFSTEEKKVLAESLESPEPLRELNDAVRTLLGKPDRNPAELYEGLDEFRWELARAGRGNEEDIVLEVMDFLVGWASPHMSLKTSGSQNPGPTDGPSKTSKATASSPPGESDIPAVRLLRRFPGTSGGIWTDRQKAALHSQYLLNITATTPTTILLDLTGIIATPGVLQDLILPLGERVRSGLSGPLKLVVRTHDQGAADFVRYLAREHRIPIFVSLSGQGLDQAQPVGELSGTEHTTLNLMLGLGGRVTASGLADAIGIESTAAGNRLTNLAEKGYIYRIGRSRRYGDVFIDPREASDEGQVVVTAPTSS